MVRRIVRCAAFLPLFLIGCGGATLAGTGTDASDGGTPPDGGTPVSTCINTCIDSELSWDFNGGLTDGTASSNLSSCSAYSHQESEGSGDLSCTAALYDGCDNASGISAGQVAGAFENGDVQAAFAAGSTQFYGTDPRGCDGTVREIIYKGKSVLVGGDCATGDECGGTKTPCVDAPSGVKTLSDLLVALDKQELETKNCASVFPGR